MNYVNTKHMLSLWDSIVGPFFQLRTTIFPTPSNPLLLQPRPPPLLLIIITIFKIPYYYNPTYYSGLESNLSKAIDDGLMYNKIFPYFDLMSNNAP